MPIITAVLLPGRPQAVKAAFMKAVAEAAASSLGAPLETVRVIIQEVPHEHFSVGGVAKAPPGSG
ncbi:tautomerase family protein [Azospirillum halopraeferens]|uniref:tautomerase family protein n=1 Tax=Azospirillum halopraeferens TaxID=34010 RepID=UPI00041EF64C|nr:tautomerase family protein [Azospirillum halopraeferens]